MCITIIKKAGIYDADNGKKTEYYYGDVVKSEYTLLNGKINGQVKTYHYNGKLKKVGSCTNGVENGLFKEYDENGNIEDEYSMSNGELNGVLKRYYLNGKLKWSGNYLKGKEHGNFVEYDEHGTMEVEYVMANGMKNGVLKVYEGGKIDVSTTFKDDIKNGQHIEYYYNHEAGKLELKLIGDYLNDEKNGTWKLFLIEVNNTERLLTFETYIMDIKDGVFQDIKGDSLIVGSYKNDELHGEYKIYRDFVSALFGGVIRTDISELTLSTEGSYYEGLESGYWKNYDLSGSLISEGKFSNGQETGEWKYYYNKWLDLNQGHMPHSQKLFLIQNYSNGKLEGKSTRYSHLNEEQYPCYDKNEDKNPLDTCKRLVFRKVLETSFYKNGILNGPVEFRDSTNNIIVQGNFKDNLKDGEWLQRYTEQDDKEENNYIYQKGNYQNGKREGQWIEYYQEGKTEVTFNYKNDELHGDYYVWNGENEPKIQKKFNNGSLTDIWNYDELGTTITSSFVNISLDNSIISCIHSFMIGDTLISQGYKFSAPSSTLSHGFFENLFFLSVGDENKIVYGEFINIEKKSNLSEDKLTKLDFIKNPIGSINNSYDVGISKGWQFDGPCLIQINGKLQEEGNCKNHYKNGLWTRYFYDQNVKILSNFILDKRLEEKYLKLNGELFSGIFVYNDYEIEMKEERKIKDGVRNGKTVYIDAKTNKTIKKESYKNGELR